mgnify:CR=1 FL=1
MAGRARALGGELVGDRAVLDLGAITAGVDGVQSDGVEALAHGLPALAQIRQIRDRLAAGQQVVVFPEGRIQRRDQPIKLHLGLVRLAQLAQRRGVSVPVIPVGLGYSQAPPRPFSRAAICFGEPMQPPEGGREAGLRFNRDLATAMHAAEQAARNAVGRPLGCF